MARLKSKKNDAIDKLIKDGLLKYGNDPSLVIKRVPTGLNPLDELIGGGLPLGKIIELYGPESTGKTLIAQYLAAAIQQQVEGSNVLLMDMEDSYDQKWWAASGVDEERLLVSSPATAEQAIDIMRNMLQAENFPIGMVIIDSLAGMTPFPEMDPDRSSEEKSMGLQAKVITLMFRQIKSLLGDTVLLMTNQLRESIGNSYAASELDALPGGRANRHFCHVMLRTRRESWINDDKNHIGFNMEIVNRKNKLATIADGDSVILPFLFTGQIDMAWAYVEEALEKELIHRSGGRYYYQDFNWFGKPAMREYFSKNDLALSDLKADLATAKEN